VVIAVGAMGAVTMVRTAPKAEERAPVQSGALVQIMPVRTATGRTVVRAMGTVMAAKEIVLQPRVSGEIVKLNPEFVPGGRLREGEVILQIDPQDYDLAVEKSRSEVARATYEIKMERGHQDIARHEWELLGMGDSASDLDRELALRKPHLEKADAALAAAQAGQREAELSLERTTIRAPFNGIVTTENVDLGTQVTPQTQLGTFVGTDEYWVKVSVPVDRLKWVRFPAQRGERGSPVRVYPQLGTDDAREWVGYVFQLLGDLEPQGRMARVLVAVQDPLGLASSGTKSFRLLIGSYVNVDIEGIELPDVISAPRAALRDGNGVWLMNDAGELEIKQVDITYRDRDTVLISGGLEAGEKLVVSDLRAAVEGMKLRLESDEDATAAAARVALRQDGNRVHDGK